jgi:hypothetical protein
MERQEVNENTVTGTVGAAAVAAASQAATSSNAAALSGLKEASLAVAPAKSGVSPMQAIPPPCPTCGGAVVEGATRMTSHIYALGQIEALPASLCRKGDGAGNRAGGDGGQDRSTSVLRSLAQTREPLSSAANVLGPDGPRARNLHRAAARSIGPRSSHQRD